MGTGVMVEQCWLTLLAARSTRSWAFSPEGYVLSMPSPSLPFRVLKYWILPEGTPSGAVSKLLCATALAIFGANFWLRSPLMMWLKDYC